jgi:hypothetical protein
VQKTDAGKIYLRGIRLALKYSGKKFVPKIPVTKKQARAILGHLRDLLAVFREQPDWSCPPHSARTLPAPPCLRMPGARTLPPPPPRAPASLPPCCGVVTH